jgi:hypothetical protein
MTAPTKRGGARPGSGPKALTAGGAPVVGLKRVNLMLDAASVEKAREIGGGNVSQGVRIALAEYQTVRRPE